MADPSPLVTRLSWGRVATETGTFRDAKLWPGGGRGWDWTETGTHHDPGIQPADVEELLERQVARVVLSRGQQGRLRVMEATLETLADHGVEVEVLLTREAVDRYNQLAEQGRPVGALLHSTC